MKKISPRKAVPAIAMVAALAFGGATIAPSNTEPAAAASCSISGASTAYWGCGKMTSFGWGQHTASVRVQDLWTDGHAIRIQVKSFGSSTWVDQGISHGSSSIGYYTVSGSGGQPISGIRMKRGWTSSYRTLYYDPT